MPIKPIITKKREEIVHVILTKATKPIVEVTTQHVKLAKYLKNIHASFVLVLNTMHYIVFERRNSKTCFILRQTLLLL